MNIFSYNKKSNQCFAELIATIIDTTKKPSDPGYIKINPGLSVKVFGQTKGTKVLRFFF